MEMEMESGVQRPDSFVREKKKIKKIPNHDWGPAVAQTESDESQQLHTRPLTHPNPPRILYGSGAHRATCAGMFAPKYSTTL